MPKRERKTRDARLWVPDLFQGRKGFVRGDDVILGIDPGLYGAAMFVSMDGLAMYGGHLPRRDLGGNRFVAQANDGAGLFEMCQKVRHEFGPIIHAYIEDPGIHSKSSVSLATLHHSFGSCEAIVCALGIPLTRIPVNDWKRAYALWRKGKRESVATAVRLNPELGKLRTSEDGDIAEATLVARYGLKYRRR